MPEPHLPALCTFLHAGFSRNRVGFTDTKTGRTENQSLDLRLIEPQGLDFCAPTRCTPRASTIRYQCRQSYQTPNLRMKGLGSTLSNPKSWTPNPSSPKPHLTPTPSVRALQAVLPVLPLLAVGVGGACGLLRTSGGIPRQGHAVLLRLRLWHRGRRDHQLRCAAGHHRVCVHPPRPCQPHVLRLGRGQGLPAGYEKRPCTCM